MALKYTSTDVYNALLKKISDEGLDTVLNRKYLKKIYNDIAKKYGVER